jgi:uncharacterized protein (DUF924 family)
MKSRDWAAVTPDEVLDFWFPNDDHEADFDAHRIFWTWRMRGGADDAIRQRFADLTEAAAKGLLDQWAETPRGRLALVIALDQFPRSVWRGTPAAFAQDIRATRLVLEGLQNGHYDALPNVWEKAFCLIAVGHCEGPDHLARLERTLSLAKALVDESPEHLRVTYRMVEDQNRFARDIIAKFGRHPHRNAVLGRVSTPAEEVYIAAGEFPHVRKIPATKEGMEQLLAEQEGAAGKVRSETGRPAR